MEPKTKLQKQVIKLSEKLPALTPCQRKWAVKKCFEFEGFYRAKKIWCVECGDVFEAKESFLSHTLIGATCPCCGKHLKVTSSRKRKYAPNNVYFTIVTTLQGFQVLRHYIASKSARIGQPADYRTNEAVQNWISPKGVEVIIARLATYYGGAYDNWSWNTRMEIRQDSYIDSKYHIWSRHIKTIRLLPKLKYAGIDDNYYGITPDMLFRMLLRYPFVETLIKQNDRALLEYMEQHISQVAKHWPSLKIARRHGLKFDKHSDIRMYFDYLDMSDAIGRDMRSPKYLCPKSLKAAHDEVLKIKQKLDARIEVAKKRDQALKDEGLYQKLRGKFLDIAFGDELIQLHVLQSVVEFLEEGCEMHHCVFANKYYKNSDSLIMSARIKGERIETVEVSLRTMKVIQSRGVRNEITQYHKRIIGLVENNMNLIRKKMASGA